MVLELLREVLLVIHLEGELQLHDLLLEVVKLGGIIVSLGKLLST